MPVHLRSFCLYGDLSGFLHDVHLLLLHDTFARHSEHVGSTERRRRKEDGHGTSPWRLPESQCSEVPA